MGHQKMRWDQLLCDERQGHEQHPGETQRNRNQFERDFDRIIFSDVPPDLRSLITRALSVGFFSIGSQLRSY
jgi:hypothetical protein